MAQKHRKKISIIMTKRYSLTSSFILIFIFFIKISYSQEPNFSQGLQNARYTREKIYIHFDKHNYLRGDTVWFKAYLFEGSERSRFSKNFYFEIISPNGELIRRFTGPIYESTASGNIVLPLDSNVNGYFCRAYTILELNSDTSFMYKNFLRLSNSSNKSQIIKQTDPAIKFMPEGGNWVTNIPCVMAFKVTNGQGLPASAAGYIKDDKNNIITSFQTIHDGMGEFIIIPQDERKYSAVWKSSTGKEQFLMLPPVQKQGIALQVTATPNGKRFMIFRSKSIIESKKRLTILASLNSKIIYKAKVDLTLDEGSHDIINTKGLASGILNITVFDNEFNPIAERISFINNENYSFVLEANFGEINKKRHGLNIIKLTKKDSVRSNISVSITDPDLDPFEKYHDNIISHLLFTGDLRGKILNPFYYFENTADSTLKNLDLVMLTHGWRKYDWKQVIDSANSIAPKETNFLSLTGKITEITSSFLKSNPTVNILLTTVDSSVTLFTLPINKDGVFFKEGIIFYGKGKLYFSFNKKNGVYKSSQIIIKNGLLDKYHSEDFGYESKNEDYSKDISIMKLHLIDSISKERNFLSNSLKEVVIKGKPIKNITKLDEKYTGGLFKGGISQQYDIGNDPTTINYRSFFQYLQGRVPGIQVSEPTSINPTVSWRSSGVKFFLNNYESSATDIRSIDMTEFMYMKVYDPSQGGVFGANGGVIAVYTKTGKGTKDNKKRNQSLVSSLDGYSIVKEFYSPDYATEVTSNLVRDTRTTLYWNPNLTMDENTHEFDIRFFNNDFSKRFKIVIEGINFRGKLIFEQKIF